VLGAQAVLFDFLAAPHAIADPVERVGTETVIDCAARTPLHCDDPQLRALLLGLAETRLLPGAIDRFGAQHCVEALPCLVATLGDDIAHPANSAPTRTQRSQQRPASCGLAAEPRPAAVPQCVS
jgi:hypothetical protein